MGLQNYIQILRRRIWIIAITAVIAMIVAILGRIFVPIPLTSTAILRVVPPSSVSYSTTERIMNTFISIAESQPIVDEVRNQLGLDSDLDLDMSVSQIPNSEILEITVTDPDPVLAQNVADTYTQIIYNARPIADVRIIVIEPASIPTPPSKGSQVFFLMLTGLVGLIGGIGLAFLFENLDTRLISKDSIEALTGLPVIGEIPRSNVKDEARFLVDFYPYSDAYLRFRTNLLSVDGKIKNKVLMISSAEPMDGKSTVTANTARIFGQAGINTLIIDADLHNPSLHTFYSLDNEIGLGQALKGEKRLDQVIRETEFSNIDVISSGPQQQLSAELFRAEKLKQVLMELKRKYDLILIDTPAILGVVDGLVIAPFADSIILVSNYGQTSESSLKSCVQQLNRVHPNIIGVVINQVKFESKRYFDSNSKAAQVGSKQRMGKTVPTKATQPEVVGGGELPETMAGEQDSE